MADLSIRSSQNPPSSEPLSTSVSSSTARSQSPTDSTVSPSNQAIGERDGLELRQFPTQDDNETDDISTASISSGEYRVTTRRTVSRSTASQQTAKGVWGRIQRFWTHTVVLTVPQKNNRDHFALERTFLGYIRTSVAVAMQGVLVAQLFRLQRSTAEQGSFSYFEVGVPLAVTCHCVAILIALMGAHRFWKQQSNVSQGKVQVGGWELNGIGLFVGLINTVIFILSLVIIARNHR